MFDKKLKIDEEVFEDFIQKAAFLLLQDDPALPLSDVQEKLVTGMHNRQQFQALAKDAVGYDYSRTIPYEDLVGAGVWDALVRLIQKCVEHAYRQFRVDYFAEMFVDTGMLRDDIKRSDIRQQVLMAAFVKETSRAALSEQAADSIGDLKRVVIEEFIKKYSLELFKEMNDASRPGYRIDFDLETMHLMYMASAKDGRIKDAFRRYNFEDKA